MANLPEQSVWQDGIYQLEEGDDVRGGPLPEGISNLQAKQLADRTRYLKGLTDSFSFRADMVEGEGRNLLTVLGVSTIPEAMAKLRLRCNNNHEIDWTGTPDFRGIMIGDFIDGLDLSGISVPPGNYATAPQPWNGMYINNRIVVSGFNTYKNIGDFPNEKNFILFTFRNNICQSQMTNGEGYLTSELRAWLEGANGDGNSDFALGLQAALGGDYLYTIRKIHAQNNGHGSVISDWQKYTVWLPTEIEVLGYESQGNEAGYRTSNVHFPIYRMSTVYRWKKYNGFINSWLLSTTTSSPLFCAIHQHAGYSFAYNSGSCGVSPAFCVA